MKKNKSIVFLVIVDIIKDLILLAGTTYLVFWKDAPWWIYFITILVLMPNPEPYKKIKDIV